MLGPSNEFIQKSAGESCELAGMGWNRSGEREKGKQLEAVVQ
jgi:hypothetical protein